MLSPHPEISPERVFPRWHFDTRGGQLRCGQRTIARARRRQPGGFERERLHAQRAADQPGGLLGDPAQEAAPVLTQWYMPNGMAHSSAVRVAQAMSAV